MRGTAKWKNYNVEKWSTLMDFTEHWLDLDRMRINGKWESHMHSLLMSSNMPLRETMSSSERKGNSEKSNKLAT